MSKLLSISIPTFNRADMLLQQLRWLAQEVADFTEECNIIVHDNCSTDDTCERVNAWRSTINPNIDFTYLRHEKNIGGMANIESCIKGASGKFVWTLGDDDPIQPGTVADIIKYLKTYPDLGLLLLNGNGRDARSGELRIKQWFHRPVETPGPVNSNDFRYFLLHNSGGILFISSVVYRTEFAHNALLAWPNSNRNLAAQAFWVAYCAARGSFIITSKIYTECAMGIGFTDKDPKWTFKMRYIDFPEVFRRLMIHGYDKTFCLRRVLSNIKNKNSTKILLGSFRRWPLFATAGGTRYLSTVVKTIGLYIFRRKPIVATQHSAIEEVIPVPAGYVNINS